MINRTVSIRLMPEFDEITGNNTKQAADAVGYLATWAIHSVERYKGEVSIFGDSRGDLHGTYRNTTGEVTFQLFGQRGEDGSYTFHS